MGRRLKANHFLFLRLSSRVGGAIGRKRGDVCRECFYPFNGIFLLVLGCLSIALLRFFVWSQFLFVRVPRGKLILLRPVHVGQFCFVRYPFFFFHLKAGRYFVQRAVSFRCYGEGPVQRVLRRRVLPNLAFFPDSNVSVGGSAGRGRRRGASARRSVRRAVIFLCTFCATLVRFVLAHGVRRIWVRVPVVVQFLFLVRHAVCRTRPFSGPNRYVERNGSAILLYPWGVREDS